jgi:hypothetical protein
MVNISDKAMIVLLDKIKIPALYGLEFLSPHSHNRMKYSAV